MVISTKEQIEIAHNIKDISFEDADRDFANLKILARTKLSRNPPKNIKTGIDVVDYFTFPERLHTVGYQGLSFFDFLRELPELKQKKYIRNMVEFYHRERPQTPPLKMWYRIFSLYFGSINSFKPSVALSVYQMKTPNELRILDPTMGWGGRLVAAAAWGAHSYFGIDSNLRLKTPYARMCQFLTERHGVNTHFELCFTDAIQFDYSGVSYNMVFTSPPYYDIETYSYMNAYSTKKEWNEQFYIPLFRTTMHYLDNDGVFCINIPIEIYKNVCIPLWGAAHTKIPMPLASRTRNPTQNTYKEFIYVWYKSRLNFR